MLIVDAQVHIWSQGTPSGQHRQISSYTTDIARMSCSWRQCVTMFTEELPWLKGRDLELVMGQGVCDWIGWKLPG